MYSVITDIAIISHIVYTIINRNRLTNYKCADSGREERERGGRRPRGETRDLRKIGEIYHRHNFTLNERVAAAAAAREAASASCPPTLNSEGDETVCVRRPRRPSDGDGRTTTPSSRD